MVGEKMGSSFAILKELFRSIPAAGHLEDLQAECHGHVCLSETHVCFSGHHTEEAPVRGKQEGHVEFKTDCGCEKKAMASGEV